MVSKTPSKGPVSFIWYRKFYRDCTQGKKNVHASHTFLAMPFWQGRQWLLKKIILAYIELHPFSRRTSNDHSANLQWDPSCAILFYILYLVYIYHVHAKGFPVRCCGCCTVCILLHLFSPVRDFSPCLHLGLWGVYISSRQCRTWLGPYLSLHEGRNVLCCCVTLSPSFFRNGKGREREGVGEVGSAGAGRQIRLVGKGIGEGGMGKREGKDYR